MVLLTRSFIEKECMQIQSNKSLTKQIGKNHLTKITHLYMNDKFIEAIGNFCGCKNLRVIYMQNNCISKIENVNFCINLTHLYLQHNNIKKIENLHGLIKLKSLFLGYNSISIVEGLESLINLSEFHIEHQKLAVGEDLLFDPRSLQTISKNLKIFNLAGDKITSLNPLKYFVYLERLDASHNEIANLQDVTEAIFTLTSLRFLFLQNNPVSLIPQYRESIISYSDSIEHLDGKDVSNITRLFLKKFKEEQQRRLEKSRSKLFLSDDITTSLNLPPAFRKSVSRAILQQQPGLPKLSIINSIPVNGEMQCQIFPPWKSGSTIAGRRDVPRLLWRTKSKVQSLKELTTEKIPLPSINYLNIIK